MSISFEPTDHSKSVFLDRETHVRESFAGLKVPSFTSVGSTFDRCDFRKVRFGNAAFGAGKHESVYTECVFDGSRLVMLAGGFATFVRCSFRNVNINHWFAFETQLIDCVFSGKLRKVVINGTVPEDHRPWVGRDINEISGNDFHEARFDDVGFRTGVELVKQVLPDDPRFLFVPGAVHSTRLARGQLIRWHDLEERRALLLMLGGIEETVAGGQHQMLLSKDWYPKSQTKYVDTFFRLLSESE